jgi:hypothetical protein
MDASAAKPAMVVAATVASTGLSALTKTLLALLSHLNNDEATGGGIDDEVRDGCTPRVLCFIQDNWRRVACGTQVVRGGGIDARAGADADGAFSGC